VDSVTAPSPLTDFIGIQFVLDPAGSTPPAAVQFAGMTFWFPPEYQTKLGSGAGNPGVIDGVRGYTQVGGPTGLQWVMISSITGAVRDQFLALPGGSGWVSTAARNIFRNVALQLIETYNIPAPSVLTALTNLYNAAVANDHAVPPGG
jgi:hypothetical protein